ncbi:MAG: hypothetical protein K0Q47_1521 [Sedimentibacter sp.]|nr:hypothetical protein [Sedimentibacter sp.]
MTDINFIRKISNLNSSIQPGTNLKHNQDIDSSFKDIFKEKFRENEVTFSKHANERISERNIDVSPEVTDKLNEAVEQAKDKGLKNEQQGHNSSK